MALADNLVSYWKFDEASGNAVDSQGSNTLTDVNTVTSGTAASPPPPPDSSGAYRLFTLANNEYFRIVPGPANINNLADGDFTLACWIKRASLGTNQILFGKTESAKYFFYIMLNASDAVWVRTWTVNASATLVNFTTGNLNSTSAWYYLVIQRAAGVVGISINGAALVTATETGGNTSSSDSAFTVGADSWGGGGGGIAFDGWMASAACWSRAITADEITELYSSGSGKAWPWTVNATMSAAVCAATAQSFASIMIASTVMLAAVCSATARSPVAQFFPALFIKPLGSFFRRGLKPWN